MKNQKKKILIEDISLHAFFTDEEIEKLRSQPDNIRRKSISSAVVGKLTKLGNTRGISSEDVLKTLNAEVNEHTEIFSSTSLSQFSESGSSKLGYLTEKLDSELMYGKQVVNDQNAVDKKNKEMENKQNSYESIKNWSFRVRFPDSRLYAKEIISMPKPQGYARLKENILQQLLPQCAAQNIPKEFLTGFFPDNKFFFTKQGNIKCNGQKSFIDLLATYMYSYFENMALHENKNNKSESQNLDNPFQNSNEINTLNHIENSKPSQNHSLITSDFHKLTSSVNENEPNSINRLLDNPKYDNLIRRIRNKENRLPEEEEALEQYKYLKHKAQTSANEKVSQNSQEAMGPSIPDDNE